MTRTACIGEAMIELSRIDLAGGQARVGVAGDTYNTAVYLARLLGHGVSYVTNLGTDALSDAMLRAMADEGIDTSLIGRHPTALPGLYAIELDPHGERSFRYWRQASAARTLFGAVGPGLDDLEAFDLIHLSGITLAILPDTVRDALIAKLAELRNRGCRIAFDGNYRARLWQDVDVARTAFDAMWRATSIALPSLDDETALHPGATPEDVVARLHALGVPEILLKAGADGPILGESGEVRRLGLPQADHVVDTSGAGDSFGAGYLAARLRGAGPEEAARAGHALALAVIGRHGAVIPADAMPAA